MTTRKTIPKPVRAQVWEIYNAGSTRGNCYCCGIEEITVHNYVCGRVVSVKHGGGSTVDNLRPICSKCSKSMKSENMDDFMKEYGLPHKTKAVSDINIQPFTPVQNFTMEEDAKMQAINDVVRKYDKEIPCFVDFFDERGRDYYISQLFNMCGVKNPNASSQYYYNNLSMALMNIYRTEGFATYEKVVKKIILRDTFAADRDTIKGYLE